MNQKNVGLVISYVYNMLNIFIGLFMSTFVLNQLGKTQYGIYQTIAAFATYLVFFEFGAGTVMSRNIACCRGKNGTKEDYNRNISTVLFITFILSIIIVIVSFVFFFNMDNIYNSTLTAEQLSFGKVLFVVMTAYIIISFCNQAITGICNGFEYFTFTKSLQLFTLLLRTTIVVVFLSFFKTSITLVLADLLISIISLALTIFYCVKRIRFCVSFRLVDVGILKSALPLALALFLNGIINQANNNVDKFLISIMLGPESVAVYAIGMFVYMAFSSISTIPISIFQPGIVKQISERGIDSNTTRSLVSPSRLLVVTGGAILFGFIACGKPFINVFYGSEYIKAWYIAMFVMGPMFINMCYGLLVNVLDALGKRLVRSVVLMVTTIANIIVTALSIPRFGMVSAAIATAICTLIGQCFVMNYYYEKFIGIDIIYLTKSIFKGILPSLLISCFIAGLVVFFISNQMISLIVGMITYLFVLLLLLVWFGLNSQEKEILHKKLNLLFSKCKKRF